MTYRITRRMIKHLPDQELDTILDDYTIWQQELQAELDEIQRAILTIRQTMHTRQAFEQSGIDAHKHKTKAQTGPKPKLDSHQDEIMALVASGTPKETIARQYGVTPGRIYQWLKEKQP